MGLTRVKDKRPVGYRPVSPGIPVTCPYGKPGDWKRGYHAGIDFGCPRKTDVMAWRNGLVGWAGDAGDEFGRYVRLEHDDGTRSYYCHLDSIFVVAGAHVKKGEVLGLSGNTGKVKPKPTPKNPNAGAHLHFETRLNGEPFEPGFEEAGVA